MTKGLAPNLYFQCSVAPASTVRVFRPDYRRAGPQIQLRSEEREPPPTAQWGECAGTEIGAGMGIVLVGTIAVLIASGGALAPVDIAALVIATAFGGVGGGMVGGLGEDEELCEGEEGDDPEEEPDYGGDPEVGPGLQDPEFGEL